jgi:hypothetical protein
MMIRPCHSVVGVLALIASACSDSNLVPLNTVAVRFVNATDTPLSIVNGSVLDTVSARIAFGQASACMSVDVSNISGVAITNAATGQAIAFAPNLTPRGSVIVVAFAGTTSAIRLATLNDRFQPATNDAGLRFFNGVSGTGPLIMQRVGVDPTPFVVFGTASGFVSVSSDSASTTFANQFSIVLDAGRLAFPPGSNSTVVLGPPAPQATAPLRFFTVQGC